MIRKITAGERDARDMISLNKMFPSMIADDIESIYSNNDKDIILNNTSNAYNANKRSDYVTTGRATNEKDNSVHKVKSNIGTKLEKMREEKRDVISSRNEFEKPKRVFSTNVHVNESSNYLEGLEDEDMMNEGTQCSNTSRDSSSTVSSLNTRSSANS